MAVLLKHGATCLVNDTEEQLGHLPIDYAIACDCSETVSMLLEKDSALYHYPRYGGVLSSIIEHGGLEVTNLIIESLVDRRRRLQDLAVRSLPSAALQRLNLDEDRLLDEKAYSLQAALVDGKIQVSPSLAIPERETTVFHEPDMTAELAEFLYKSGLWDVNGRYFRNMTPLSTISDSLHSGNVEAHLSYSVWLVSREPEALRSVQGDKSAAVRTTAAHRFASVVRAALREGVKCRIATNQKPVDIFVKTFERNSVRFYLTRELLAADWSDNCICACSGGGCLPYFSMLKGSRRPHLRFDARWRGISDMYTRLLIVDWLQRSQDAEFRIPASVWNKMIRLETFNALGLTHICCYTSAIHPGLKRMHVSGAEAIREEEADLINHLEVLISEFEDEFHHCGSAITAFLKGYWQRRMAEELSGKNQLELRPEEHAKLRELGVVLYHDPRTVSLATDDSGIEEVIDSRGDCPTGNGDGMVSNDETYREASSDSDEEFFEPSQ
ncbi:MAG: hypothetical protein M1820_004127 [Bogoriella megaspora]|nr:MAG: hypothetical protein M1820_004127 [Bogoriella megaspora]